MGKLRLLVLLIAVLAITIGCNKQANDSQLTEQIQTKLNHDSGLQDKSIAVQTQNGVVTLSGTVENDAQRTAAARYAASTAGIKEVVNNLQVGATAPAQTAEATPPPPPPPVVEKPKAAEKPRPPKKRSGKKDPSQWDTQNSASSNAGVDNSANNQMASADASNNVPAAPAQPVAPPPPPPPPPPKKITIPSGTTVAVRLIDAIDSETAQQGQTFRATLDSPLASEGEIAVPAGHKVEGHVVDVKSAGKFAGQSLLVLQLDRINADGNWYNVQTEQYKREGSSRGKNTAEKVGAGAAIGAIIGGLAGGGKGAGIGAAAGGGLGGGVQAATKGQQIKLASESVVNFTLQSPVTVTQVQNGPGAGRPKLDTPQ
ncbi:MAG TPA: BON domain-containing protein [Terriglobales bacterium]|nr:BON domain-containing protein [Terriglobales bacterium]